MKLIIIVLLVAILVALMLRRPNMLTKECPKGYYYAPWAASGTQCLPIGEPSSEAGISTDSTVPQMYSPKMSPAWEENAVFYSHLMNPQN
jgi:hypothetical protein